VARPGIEAGVADRAEVNAVRTENTSPGLYEIRVQGRLEPRWSTWFGGFTLTLGADGTTVITGTVVDQSALHGVLQSLRDLGLPLVSVTQPQGERGQGLTSGAPRTDAADPRPTTPAQEDLP
jgi:hypothetical protein